MPCSTIVVRIFEASSKAISRMPSGLAAATCLDLGVERLGVLGVDHRLHDLDACLLERRGGVLDEAGAVGVVAGDDGDRSPGRHRR